MAASEQEIMQRETIEEGRYEVARAAALIVTATADEFRDRLKTQVESYGIGMRRDRNRLDSAEMQVQSLRERLRDSHAHMGTYATALAAANAEIVRLGKKARVAYKTVADPGVSLASTVTDDDEDPF